MTPFHAPTFPEKVTAWGKAILVSGAILTGSIGIARKAASTIAAGPEAKAQADGLEIRVSHVERMVRFLVHDAERRSGRHYQEERGDDAR